MVIVHSQGMKIALTKGGKTDMKRFTIDSEIKGAHSGNRDQNTRYYEYPTQKIPAQESGSILNQSLNKK